MLLCWHSMVERDGAGHGGGQRLRAAHAAQAGRQYPAPGPVAAEMLAARLGKGFIGALHDALGADIDPAAGRHLAVHEQALAIEFVEVFPVGPFRHQVGVGDQHARRVRVGAKHADRFAGLDQQGLVFFQFAQGGQDLVETGPVARRAADAAVDHQVLRIFCHLGIEIVLHHAVGRLDLPVLAGQFGAARGADAAAGVEARIAVHLVHAVSSQGGKRACMARFDVTSIGCLYKQVNRFCFTFSQIPASPPATSAAPASCRSPPAPR